MSLCVVQGGLGCRDFALVSFEWNGDWSDTSLLWTPAFKAEVKFVDDKDDGAFWMVRTCARSLPLCCYR